MIAITINGIGESIKGGMTIRDFILSNNLNPDNVIVEYNFWVISQKEVDYIILKEHDRLELPNYSSLPDHDTSF
jgi:thiamine biosynthesis protein ThiS